MPQGDEVHGAVHSNDASGGIEVPLYQAGGTDARALQSNEHLTITDIIVVAAVGGDVHVFLGDDATPGDGETVVRGPVANNGGLAMSFIGTPRRGAAGHMLYVIAPAGVVDVSVTGRITQA